LNAAHNLVVSVTESNGDVIEGARVRVSKGGLAEIQGLAGVAMPFGDDGIHESLTDKDGIARFDSLSRGRYHVSVDARWYVQVHGAGQPEVPGPVHTVQLAPVMGEVLRFEGDAVVAAEVQYSVPLISIAAKKLAMDSASAYLAQRFPHGCVVVATPTTSEVKLWVLGRTSGWTMRRQELKRVSEISAPSVVYIPPGRGGPRTGHVVLEGEKMPFPLQFVRLGEPRNVADMIWFAVQFDTPVELPEGRYAVIAKPAIARKLLGQLAEVTIRPGRTVYARISQCEPYRVVRLVARRSGAPVNLADIAIYCDGESVGTLYGFDLSRKPLFLPANEEIRLRVRRIRGPWCDIVIPKTSEVEAPQTTFSVDLD